MNNSGLGDGEAWWTEEVVKSEQRLAEMRVGAVIGQDKDEVLMRLGESVVGV